MNFFVLKKGGLSLIELLIYLAVLSILMVGVADIFFVTMRIRAQNNAKLLVNENARVILGKMREAILDASAMATSGVCPANKLDLTIGGSTTSFQITNGIMEIVEGINPAKPLTAANVIASTNAPCLFTTINNPAPAKSTVQIQLRIAYNTSINTPAAVSQDYALTVSLR